MHLNNNKRHSSLKIERDNSTGSNMINVQPMVKVK